MQSPAKKPFPDDMAGGDGALVAPAGAADSSPMPPSPLAALHQFALRLASAPTRAAVAEVLLLACVSTLRAVGGVLAAAEPARRTFCIAGASGVPENLLPAFEASAPDAPSAFADAAGWSEVWLGSREEAMVRFPQLAAALGQSDFQGWGVIPLRVEHQALGVLLLAFPSAQPSVPELALFLATLPVQAATALARLQQAEVAQHQTARMQAFAEISQAFARPGPDLEAVLGQVVRRVSELVGGACAIRLIDPDGLHLQLVALYHPDEELAAGARALLAASPQRVDEGLAAAVLSRGEPVLLATVDQAALRANIRPVFHAHLDRWPITSMMTVPLRTHTGAIGLLSLTCYAGERPYTGDDQSFLMDLADRAALAIANAQLYASASAAKLAAERAAAHTQRLQALTASLAEALTPGEVMSIVAMQVDQLVGEASGLIGLVTDDGHALEIVQMARYTPGELRPWQHMPLERGVAAADVVLSGEAQFWETRAALLGAYPQLAEAPIRSEAWAIVPLRAEGRTLGMLSLGFPTPRTFDPEERALLELLAQQCATALQRTERYLAVEQARATAEQARAVAEQAADRTARLYAVTAALAEALTLTQVADVIVTQGIAALGANAGSVRQLSPDGSALVALQVVGYPDDLASQWQVIPIDAPLPMAEAARLARPILIESPDEIASSWPQFVDAMAALSYKAVALLPLMVAGRPIGTMSFGFVAPRPFDAEDRRFLEALARQCAAALERARLYAATQAQADRLGSLAESSKLFAAASLDLPSVLDAVAWRAAHAIGDLGVVGLLSDDRRFLRLAAIAHQNPEAQEVMEQLLTSFPLGANEGISSRALRTGEAQLLAAILPEQLRSLIKPEHWPYLDRFGIYSLMVVPLRVNGEVIGTLGALRDSPGRPYTESDLTLLQELADRAALAVANARLYQQAQDAIKIRDQFLSIAAHELKTPLTALSAQAQLVQRRLSRGEQTPERLVRSIDTIVGQTERLDVMVRALLDVGRIERGQFVLERQPVNLAALVERVLEEAQPDMERHSLTYKVGTSPLLVDGDALRLEQVVQNLLSNAVKYSPAGGTINVGVERREGRAVITVADQGVGIPTDAIPQLFQRFYRAANVKDHHISGMGIGLYVVREIVTLHGGSVEVTSSEGEGSVFTVSLPLSAEATAGGA